MFPNVLSLLTLYDLCYLDMQAIGLRAYLLR
jgi:hypothetical protein